MCVVHARGVRIPSPSVTCLNLDLEALIQEALPLEGVTHVGGDMFDSSTLPACDLVLMKHVLADWADDDAARALKACSQALRGSVGGRSVEGRVVIAEDVLPDGEDARGTSDIKLYVDALLMLVGNRGERTESQWRSVAEVAGLEVESIIRTSSPSLDLIVLRLCHP